MEEYGHEGNKKQNIIGMSSSRLWVVIYRLMGKAEGMNCTLAGFYAKKLELGKFYDALQQF